METGSPIARHPHNDTKSAMKIFGLLGRSREFHDKLEGSRPRLYRMARAWCRNAVLADDLVQECLSKALQNSAQLRDLATMDSWLFSILANCLRDHLRQHRATEDIDEVAEQHLVSERTPEDEYARNEIVTRVRAAIKCLPLGQRQVLVLVDVEECSYAEVAQILDIPVGTVMSRLSRARQALKAKLLAPAPRWHANAVETADNVVRLK